jgi:hypothetical protein
MFRLLITAILRELVDKKKAQFFDYPKDGGRKLTRNVWNNYEPIKRLSIFIPETINLFVSLDLFFITNNPVTLVRYITRALKNKHRLQTSFS